MRSHNCLPAALALSTAIGCNLPDVDERKVDSDINKTVISATITEVADGCKRLMETTSGGSDADNEVVVYGAPEIVNADACICKRSDDSVSCLYAGRDKEPAYIRAQEQKDGLSRRFSIIRGELTYNFEIKCSDTHGLSRYCGVIHDEAGNQYSFVPEFNRRGYLRNTKTFSKRRKVKKPICKKWKRC
jgi:hypothetical protein